MIVEIGMRGALDGKKSMLEKDGRSAGGFPDWDAKHMD